MSQEGFLFENAEAALKYYERCEKEGAKTREECIAVMRQMAKEKLAVYIPHPEELLKTHNILKIEPKGDAPNV